jgi:hypothetical protein
MFGLVESDVAAAGKRNLGQMSPPFFGDGVALYLSFLKLFHCALQVIAHEKQLVNVVFLRGMEGNFRGRQFEDQPTVSGIDGTQLKHIAKKLPIRLGILAVNHYMGAGEHNVPSAVLSSDPLVKAHFVRAFLLHNHSACNAVAGVARRVGLVVVRFRVHDDRRPAIAEQRVAVAP